MLKIHSLNGRDRSRYAVCGLGPAGCGFLLHAIKEGAIGRLVDEGLVLIDRSAVPGPGKVGSYQLTGNSLSRAFLDCIDDPKLGWLFHDLSASAPSVKQLRTMEDLAPPLDIVGEFLTIMMERTLSHLASEYDVPQLLGTSVEAIHHQADGRFDLKLQRSGGDRSSLLVDHVLCGFGGRQNIDLIRQCEVQPGLKLGDHASRLIPSDDFLMMSNEAIRQAFPFMEAGDQGDVVVVGGSHSAMSTVDRLNDALGPVGLRRIILLHRTPLRLYYASIEEAKRDGYEFDDPADICPMSGRVNRFGGLRYRSLDVGKSILQTGRTPDQTVEVVSVILGDHEPDMVRRHLERAPAVITCLGYQADLPPLIDSANQAIGLQNRDRGLEIDDDGRALAADGHPIPGLYVYGIGSRLLKRSEAVGGEPSFHGSADGVWLYHNHGGAVILDALRKTFPEQSDQQDHLRWSTTSAPIVNPG